MDLERIMSLWDRFDRSSATEMEFQTKELHFTLKKGNVNAAEEAESGKPSRQAAPEAGQKEKPQEAADGKGSILSPLAGTFYRAPSPDEEPYVSIGDLQRGESGQGGGSAGDIGTGRGAGGVPSGPDHGGLNRCLEEFS